MKEQKKKKKKMSETWVKLIGIYICTLQSIIYIYISIFFSYLDEHF